MNNRLSVLLALSVAVSSCSSGLHKIFDKKTPHEQYAARLDEKNLDETPEGRAWMAASGSALTQPVTVQLPYQQQGYFPAGRSRALGLSFAAKRGERLNFQLLKNTGEHMVLYADVFHAGSNDGSLLFSADTSATQFTVDIEETGNYILRLQPQLYQSGNYSLSVSVGPSFGFPVAGNKTKAESFWGDERDGGKRRHEGVDLFAPKRTPVVASADGSIVGVREGGIGGKVVWLKPEGRKYEIYYAHLDEQLVHEGQSVKKGEVLGLVGNTGNAEHTPSHLHFGIYSFSGAVDPYPFINPDIRSAATAPHKNLSDTLKLASSKKGIPAPASSQNIKLIPLAVSTQGYIAELPTGELILTKEAVLLHKAGKS